MALFERIAPFVNDPSRRGKFPPEEMIFRGEIGHSINLFPLFTECLRPVVLHAIILVGNPLLYRVKI